MSMAEFGVTHLEYGLPPNFNDYHYQLEVDGDTREQILEERIDELEERCNRLEIMVEKLVKTKKPSFMDFKFVK